MLTIFAVIIFILGLGIGSFLNVLALSSVGKSSVFKRRSKCPHCRETLRWYDLIPLFSYLWLRGRCRYCVKKISLQYIAGELTTAVFFTVLYVVFQSGIISLEEFIFYLIFGSILIALFITDLRFFLLPDNLVIAGFVTILAFLGVLFLLRGEAGFLWSHLWGFVAGWSFFFILYVITQGRGMGFGDVKLGALLGLVFGLREVIFIIFLAFILGAIFGVTLLILKRKKLKDALPFGPFLIISSLPAVFYNADVFHLFFQLFSFP